MFQLGETVKTTCVCVYTDYAAFLQCQFCTSFFNIYIFT